jgi:hypothetical protein
MKPNHRFWLLMIIKNLGNKKTKIVMWKLGENNLQKNENE